MIAFSGTASEIKRLKDALKQLEQDAINEVRVAVVTTIRALQAKTPVWSGETVRNYAVGIGKAPTGSAKGSIGDDPGITNTMPDRMGIPLGAENLRAQNEAAAINDAISALSRMRRLQTVVIGNLIDDAKWNLVDSGDAPTPERARYPGGVAIAGEMKARQELGSKWR